MNSKIMEHRMKTYKELYKNGQSVKLHSTVHMGQFVQFSFYLVSLESRNHGNNVKKCYFL